MFDIYGSITQLYQAEMNFEVLLSLMLEVFLIQ